MIERRIRSGRYEWRCNTCHRWYWKLPRHLKTSLHRVIVAKLILNTTYGKRLQGE